MSEERELEQDEQAKMATMDSASATEYRNQQAREEELRREKAAQSEREEEQKEAKMDSEERTQRRQTEARLEAKGSRKGKSGRASRDAPPEDLSRSRDLSQDFSNNRDRSQDFSRARQQSPQAEAEEQAKFEQEKIAKRGAPGVENIDEEGEAPAPKQKKRRGGSRKK